MFLLLIPVMKTGNELDRSFIIAGTTAPGLDDLQSVPHGIPRPFFRPVPIDAG